MNVSERSAVALKDSAIDGDTMSEDLLSVEDLFVEFQTAAGTVRAVDGFNLKVKRGQVVAIVGESGSGKSVSALSIMRLLPKRNSRVTNGRIMFEGKNLLDAGEEEMRRIRGHQISMIFQEPMTSLNPLLTIGEQIMEPLIIHLGMDGAQARDRAIELLGLVGISDGADRLLQYPHEFSGGMRQRVMIAIGLSCNPKLIIADEPTTALDVTIQAQILELMKRLSVELNIALIIITHNLGVVARYADSVTVMYAAKIVESATAEELFHRPCHPYSMGLLCSVPRLDLPRGSRLETIPGLPPNLLDMQQGCRFAARCPSKIEICDTNPEMVTTSAGGISACHRVKEIEAGSIRWVSANENTAIVKKSRQIASEPKPLLSLENVSKYFGSLKAVNGVTLNIARGETLGLVGESGCGKTTVGRMILGLEKASSGTIKFSDVDVSTASHAQMRQVRQKLQVIFQDPYSSLNPRMTVGEIIGEPIKYYKLCDSKLARQKKVASLLDQVGLPSHFSARYPHQLSGGQRQRVGIARAIAMEPECIICDEAVSALDVSIQGQIINLLEDLREELGIAYLFIAHDLAVVRHISQRVAVMYLGSVVELAQRDELFSNPQHPYTKLLLQAVPIPDPVLERDRHPQIIRGDITSVASGSVGCRFAQRCPMADQECRESIPLLKTTQSGHQVACFKAG